MAYTVKQLSAISNITVRTIHWYDKIGLLKPAYIGVNGYRYYEERELLLLQQILFFKELGFTLDDIKSLMCKGDFEILKSLMAQRKALFNNMNRINSILSSVDKTINHLKGNKKMKDKELYESVNTQHTETALETFKKLYGNDAQCMLDSAVIGLNNIYSASQEEQKKLVVEGNYILNKLVECINNQVAPDTQEVQDLIHQQYLLSCKTINMDKNIYKKSLESLKEPMVKNIYNSRHPMLSEYMYSASIHYVQSLN